MSRKHPSTNYISCMKIDGVPILPPVLTADRRKEMQYYRQLAIAVEERIQLLRKSSSANSSNNDQTVSTNYYNCGDHSYELVSGDLERANRIEEHACNNINLIHAASCPNQNLQTREDLEPRNFTSAPLLVRSNSYILDEPSPLLQAQLEKQGVFENCKENEQSIDNAKNHIGGCGDMGQTKIGLKRKLPMKYSVKSDYNGFSTSPKITNETELNTEYSTDQSSTEFIYSSKASIKGNEGSSYSGSSNTETISHSDESNDLETTVEMNAIETEVVKDASYQTSQCNGSYNESVNSKNMSNKTSLSEIIIPLEAQKSIQNLFETIQNNHTAQMQKLLDQQKADQELLKQAFEKQQAVLLNEIHKSYSLTKFCNDRSDTSSNNNCDPEIPVILNEDNNVYDFDDKQSVDTESRSEFVQASKIILTESKNLLRRASSSIDSYMESRCPSAKLSQECVSSQESSVSFQRNNNNKESTPNSTLDTSEQFYTPVNTPIKSKFEREYRRSVECFNDLKIEDINEETDYGNQEEVCNAQDSCTNISERSHVRTISNSTSLHRVTGFHKVTPEPIKDPEFEIRERASTKICAAARSFLVRRLLKTQKICSIKRAIRETLLCALKLHGDGGIKTTDADLHRRLIQQLNSACLELHDIFFKTTIEERMRMISYDREIITGPYRHRRTLSIMSNNSSNTRKLGADRQQISRRSSRSLDKNSEPLYGKIKCDH